MPGRQLAVYSRGALKRKLYRGRRTRRRRGGEEDGSKLRNLTTPTQSGGEKSILEEGM